MKGGKVAITGSRPRLVFGTHPVDEHLRANASTIVRLWVAGEGRHQEIAKRAQAAGVPVQRTTAEQLARWCGSPSHQGIAAELRPLAYATLESIVARRPRLLVAADGLEDPHNLGALIRSVAAASAGAVIIPKDRAVAVTAAVERAAAGATAWCPVCRVVNLVRALEQLRGEGFWVIGLSHRAETSLFDASLPMPAVLVVGGETGLRDLVSRACDLTVRIPMSGPIESLNASVAGAVAAFELLRRHVDSKKSR